MTTISRNWSELFIGERKFEHFEIVGEKTIVTFSVKRRDPKKCLHLQVLESRNSTSPASMCVSCGKVLMNYTLYMNGSSSTGVFLS